MFLQGCFYLNLFFYYGEVGDSVDNKIVLVTGGARSGKSVFAENYISKVGKKIAYIATAQILDEEMEHRIQLHRSRRPANWQTYEACYHAEDVLRNVTADAVLFDCLTLYTSNLLLSDSAPESVEQRYQYIMEGIDNLLAAARECSAVVVFVTNEVGMGIVPDNKLAREYRDIVGVVNQKVAQAADEVFLVVSGLAVEIKHMAVNL